MNLSTIFLQEAVPARGGFSFLLLFTLLFVLPGIALLIFSIARRRKKNRPGS